jgi:flagellar hook-associated protein 2
MSNTLRITGMATGMDTDATIKQMMSVYQTKLDKMYQDKQVVQWKQDLYREILGDINTFKSSYYDVLKSDSYMLSKNAYAGFDTKVLDSGTSNASSSVSVTAGVGATAGNYKVDFTGGNLAAAAGVKSNNKITTTAPGDAIGTTKLSELGVAGTTKITVAYTNTSSSATKDIAITGDMTLNDLVLKINSETSSNVTAKFSELTGALSINTASTGATTKLSITTDGGNLLEKLKLGASGATTVSESTVGYNIAPQNLKVKITPPGASTAVIIEKASNTFTADGVSYTFTDTKSADITITTNVQKSYDKVKTFIDKYNEMIDKIGKKIDEKKQYSYSPLTDEQKKDMSEEDIEKWEEKAKEGIIKNDSMLSNMLTSMRTAFYEGVEGAGISLSEIGLSTSSDTSMRGKIIIDEQKLKTALTNRGDQVVNLFTKASTSFSTYSPDLTSDQRKTRSKEEGIFQRISDILQDYTRTMRDSDGKKGLLLEKAGIKGDFTEFENLLTKDLNKKEDKINEMIKKMAERENRYYLQFAQLEKAMNNMNSQSSWLAQQLGTSS